MLDPQTIVIAERPGNKRADGYLNILANPHVGVLALIPGRNDTLRINGRARLVRDAPYFDDLAVKGKRPVLAIDDRDRAGLLALREGVHAVRAVGPVVVAVDRGHAVGRRAVQGGAGHAGDA